MTLSLCFGWAIEPKPNTPKLQCFRRPIICRYCLELVTPAQKYTKEVSTNLRDMND